MENFYCKVLEGGQNCGRFAKRQTAAEYFGLPYEEIVAFAPATQQFSAHSGHQYFVTKNHADKIGLVYIKNGENKYLENYVTMHDISELSDASCMNSKHLKIGRFFRYDEKFRKNRWRGEKLEFF